MQLSQDVGGRPIVFIRFNPDEYNVGEKRITSCWGINMNGMIVIKKTQKKEWNQRLLTLAEQITHWLQPENVSIKTIETVHLYFNAE